MLDFGPLNPFDANYKHPALPVEKSFDFSRACVSNDDDSSALDAGPGDHSDLQAKTDESPSVSQAVEHKPEQQKQAKVEPEHTDGSFISSNACHVPRHAFLGSDNAPPWIRSHIDKGSSIIRYEDLPAALSHTQSL